MLDGFQASQLNAWHALLIGGVFWATTLIWPSLRAIWLTRKLPGPPCLPLIGNVHVYYNLDPEQTFSKNKELYATYGPVIGFRAFHQVFVAISDPADAQLILTNPHVKSRDIFATKAVTGFMKHSLLSLKGDAAVNRRKLIAPAFHFKILKTYLETFGRKANEFCDKLAGLANGGNVNINELFNLCTMSTIFETAVGIIPEFGDEKMMNLNEQLHQGNELMAVRYVNPFLWPDWIYSLTENGRRAIKMSEEIYKLVDQHLETAYATIAKKSDARTTITTTDEKKLQCYSEIVIETALNAGKNLEASYVRGDVIMLTAAGTDTSASTMSYVLILLGMHPDYQQQAYEEQRTIFEDSLRPANSEELTKMTFLDLVIKEALRLFAPLSLMPREIPVDIKISGGYTVPAGSYAYVNAYNFHHDSRYFVDAERFWPERWLPENSVGRHPYAFLAYGAGARNCIGQKYAQIQMRATLSRLLRQFRFASDYTMEELDRIEFGVLNKSVVGYNVRISSRGNFCFDAKL